MLSTIRSLAFVVLALCLLTACTASPRSDEPAAPIAEDAAAPQAIACQTDTDCTVKNVGNCCGYYPACVHKDQTVDPDAVQARCNAEGKSSICGFPEITACACVEGRCVSSGTGIGGNGDPRIP
jgi:hypothetical protein